MPRISSPKAMLSMTLRQGKRFKFCHTMTESAPSGRRRSGACGLWTRTRPLVAGSRPPTIWINVLLPQPLGPSRQEKRPERKRWEKRSSAITWVGSSPQTCVTSSTTTSMHSTRGRDLDKLVQLRLAQRGRQVFELHRVGHDAVEAGDASRIEIA